MTARITAAPDRAKGRARGQCGERAGHWRKKPGARLPASRAPVAFYEASSDLREIRLLSDNDIGATAGSMYHDDLRISAVPEAATLTLLGFGLGGLLPRRRKSA